MADILATIRNDLTNCFDQPGKLYEDMVSEYVNLLDIAKRNSLNVSVKQTLDVINLFEKSKNRKIADWYKANEGVSIPEFNKEVAKTLRDKELIDGLGFIPTNPLEYVEMYYKHNGIKIRANGKMERDVKYEYAPGVVLDRDVVMGNPMAEAIFNTYSADQGDYQRIYSKLILTSTQYNLGFRDTDIVHAMDEIRRNTFDKLKSDKAGELIFDGNTRLPEWFVLVNSCFDTSETGTEFVVAVLQKFIWQVKLKMAGRIVTNHLMPVITGPQGKGKTVFVNKLSKVLHDYKADVDFNIITDGKTVDIWQKYILFIDEMGFFSRQDIDVVKNIITSNERTIRIMRQNSSVDVRNASTLIGCTNKNLSSLMRDETGGRRFAELQWSHTPNWDILNAVDMEGLWKSVDADGPDPIDIFQIKHILQNQQEENRHQNSVEIWAREEHNIYYQDGTNADKLYNKDDLYKDFKDWEKERFPRYDTTITNFNNKLSELINAKKIDMSRHRPAQGVRYRFEDASSRKTTHALLPTKIADRFDVHFKFKENLEVITKMNEETFAKRLTEKYEELASKKEETRLVSIQQYNDAAKLAVWEELRKQINSSVLAKTGKTEEYTRKIYNKFLNGELGEKITNEINTVVENLNKFAHQEISTERDVVDMENAIENEDRKAIDNQKHVLKQAMKYDKTADKEQLENLTRVWDKASDAITDIEEARQKPDYDPKYKEDTKQYMGSMVRKFKNIKSKTKGDKK